MVEVTKVGATHASLNMEGNKCCDIFQRQKKATKRHETNFLAVKWLQAGHENDKKNYWLEKKLDENQHNEQAEFRNSI